ncbi:hypothetical protein PHLCEN_2v10798 [Hermanssonia centrifuga]|uniref:Uncharacterized protein n=1 Tax=Hermanssonia centrifuga TaxID=98765 RepID=A0A2R6NLS5_9APHY|nr:hypothetical protein PHLCEN_2v10798 [Hermanssonia centrifuga]
MATMIFGRSGNRRKVKRIAKKAGYKYSEKTVRKVIADIASQTSRSNTQGWPEIAETLRDVDEEKIEDTKEDIDTLLVFVSRIIRSRLDPFPR